MIGKPLTKTVDIAISENPNPIDVIKSFIDIVNGSVALAEKAKKKKKEEEVPSSHIEKETSDEDFNMLSLVIEVDSLCKKIDYKLNQENVCGKMLKNFKDYVSHIILTQDKNIRKPFKKF